VTVSYCRLLAGALTAIKKIFPTDRRVADLMLVSAGGLGIYGSNISMGRLQKVCRADGRGKNWVLAGIFLLASLALRTSAHANGLPQPALGLPPVPTLASNPPTAAKAALGKRLFFDSQLSGDGTISCASCHQPDHAFTDGRSLSRGIGGRVGTRNAPTLLNVAYNDSQFWDGRRPSLESQALDPMINPLEHGLTNEKAVLDRIRENTSYVASFSVFFANDGPPITAVHVGEALATFERTLIAGDSAFDEYLYGHKSAALGKGALRGLDLFRGRAGCSECHTIKPDYALFTDNLFHSTNVGLERVREKLPELTTRLVAARRRGASVDQLILSDRDIAELGRFVVTLDPRDLGEFRTPSLRNVARTGPYMHDGSVATLREAVERELYDHRQPGHPLILTPSEKQDLLEFMGALTSPSASQVVQIH
jgi:cytochrome c peroxidase